MVESNFSGKNYWRFRKVYRGEYNFLAENNPLLLRYGVNVPGYRCYDKQSTVREKQAHLGNIKT